MWAIRNLAFLTLAYSACIYADSPIDPSINSLPGTTTTPPSIQANAPGAPSSSSSSGNTMGAQAQQNTITAMKTFKNLSYKKLSQTESNDQNSNPPLTEFPTQNQDNSSNDNASGYE